MKDTRIFIQLAIGRIVVDMARAEERRADNLMSNGWYYSDGSQKRHEAGQRERRRKIACLQALL